MEILSERLEYLKESNKELQRLINQLAGIHFQPGLVPFQYGDDKVLSELVSEILQIIKEQEEDFELLQEEMNDLNPGRTGNQIAHQQKNLKAEVEKAVEELKMHQGAFRRAQLTAKQRLEAAQLEERITLTQSRIESNSMSTDLTPPTLEQFYKQQKGLLLTKEEKEINASSDVTAALRRTHDIMAAELSRSQFAHDMLKESTEALSQLTESYSTLDTLLLSSRKLLGMLFRSQKSDTWYLETAFYILLITICWLVFRKLLYGPLLWFFWFPMKMNLRGWKGVLKAIGLEIF